MLVAVAVFVGVGAFIAIPPGPSAKTMRDTRLFCESVGPKVTMPEVIQRATEFQDKSIKTDVIDQHKILVRLHTCHCSVSFAESGTTVSNVLCNG
jgi:hypothetical protein